MQILSFRFNFVYIVFGLFIGQKTFGQSDFCDMGSRFQESVRIVQKHWWYDSNIKPTNDFFKALAEKSAGTVGSLVAGQTAHQVGDIFEGVFYLVTLRPGKALDHISNGVNPLGLVNSVISDVGSCVESPFVERGFPRESLKVGIQNISQMINDDKFHWSLPATAPLNPARHVGVYTPMSRMVMNWGGELNLDNPLYSEAVYDSRYQSEFMAMERLYCSVHNLRNKLNMDTDYYLLGYNCGGFVSDALEIAGMNSPYFANCGIGSELRALGPSVELKKSIQESCDSVIDSIPSLLTRLELGDEIPLTQWQNYKNLNPSPSLYIHLMSAALRGRNLKNLAWAKALPAPIGIYEMTGAKSDLSVVLEHLKKSLESREKKVEIADSIPSWQPSDFVNESFPDFVWRLQLEDKPLVSN
jgi:hypothetical protein